MGSEMCIRDRCLPGRDDRVPRLAGTADRLNRCVINDQASPRPWACLLYTSDAADERSSVDLGGRRIIKKKKTLIIVTVPILIEH